jgi:G3E family GTPase
MSGIDCYLITGFLGAGKTTLLNRLLAARSSDSASAPIGVIVNDFGSVAVDAGLIQPLPDGARMLSVTGGSIFCACRAGAFVDSLLVLEPHCPKQILIEASGMADPSSFARLITDAHLEGRFRIRLIACVVDTYRAERLRKVVVSIDRQIACSDLVVINKVDTAEQEEVARLERALRAVNPTARILRTTHCAVEPETIWRHPQRGGESAESGVMTPAERPAALQFDASGFERRRLERFFREQRGSLFRLKGWVQLEDQWWYVSDNAGGLEWELRTPPTGADSAVTVICSPHVAERVKSAWQGIVSTSP